MRIEDETDDVQSTCRLTYDDIEKIRNSKIWNADTFGYWPSRSEVESILESSEWNFRELPDNEKQVIEDLVETFHQIELVSVILRFVVPQHYGILSPPVEKVLGIGPFRRHSDKYLAYLRDLRKIGQIPNLRGDFWRKAVMTRNKAVHLNPPLRKNDVMKLVEGMKALRRLVDGDEIDELPAVSTDFWEWRSIDELAREQGIEAPQQFDGMIGAGGDLWDDEEDFESFVNGVREHRHTTRAHVEVNG